MDDEADAPPNYPKSKSTDVTEEENRADPAFTYDASSGIDELKHGTSKPTRIKFKVERARARGE